MSEQHGAGTTIHIEQWYYRDMESCHNRHCYGWYNELYLYTNRKPVCNDNQSGCNNNAADHADIYCYCQYLPERYGAGTTGHLEQRCRGNVESCNNQYFSSGNDGLYLHSFIRSVCRDGNTQCNGKCINHADIYCYCQYLPELGCPCASCHLEQRYYRDMEPGNGQYINRRNNELYLHTRWRTVCHDNDVKYHDRSAQYLAGIYSNRSVVPEFHCPDIAVNIKQWYYRYMESCNNQYSHGWHHDLYLYASHGSMRNRS